MFTKAKGDLHMCSPLYFLEFGGSCVVACGAKRCTTIEMRMNNEIMQRKIALPVVPALKVRCASDRFCSYNFRLFA